MKTNGYFLATVIIIGTVLVLIRVPYYYTEHIQEDAFISWRCAINLADTGVYAFNPPEKVSASTSHAYVFAVALVKRLLTANFIPLILLLNTIFLVMGIYLICSVLVPDRTQCFILWTVVSLSPTALMISYSGMETSVLILLIAALIDGLFYQRNSVYVCGLFLLLPWVRPDALAFGALIILFAGIKETRLAVKMCGCMTAGALSLFAFNYLYFGSLINQTIIAKSVCYHPSRSLEAISERFGKVFGIGAKDIGLYTPIHTKYLSQFNEFFLIAMVLGFFVCLVKYRHDSKRLTLLGLFVSLSTMVPAAYAIGGVVFPWYLWPSMLFANIVVWFLLVEAIYSTNNPARGLLLGTVFSIVAVLAIGQWCLSLSLGAQEGGYRRQIGEFVGNMSESSDTIFLEPAGYIPFYSKRYTYDEVGIVSPSVTDFQLKYGDTWWLKFIEKCRPTFLVVRHDLLKEPTNYLHTEIDKQWFAENYELLRLFRYEPTEIAKLTIWPFTMLYKLGSHTNYWVYKVRPGETRNL